MKSKTLAAVALLFFAAPTLRAGGTLKDARDTWLKGNYAEAQEIYTALLKDAKLRAPASIGLSKALQSEGEYDKALSVDRKSTRLNSSHIQKSRMPSSA